MVARFAPNSRIQSSPRQKLLFHPNDMTEPMQPQDVNALNNISVGKTSQSFLFFRIRKYLPTNITFSLSKKKKQTNKWNGHNGPIRAFLYRRTLNLDTYKAKDIKVLLRFEMLLRFFFFNFSQFSYNTLGFYDTHTPNQVCHFVHQDSLKFR